MLAAITWFLEDEIARLRRGPQQLRYPTTIICFSGLSKQRILGCTQAISC